jgi:hypothetical protein
MTLRDSVEVMTQRLDQEMLSGKGLNCSGLLASWLLTCIQLPCGKETR